MNLLPLLADISIDSFLLEAVKPAPSLAVLVWVVWKFLQHLDGLEARRASEASMIAAKANVVTGKVVTAFEENAKILGRNIEALNRTESILERFAPNGKPR